MAHLIGQRWQLGFCGRIVAQYSPFDSLWRRILLLTPLSGDTIFQEHVYNVPVIFIQNANNIADRELMVGEQVADSYLSLNLRVQAYGIGRNGKLPSNGETVSAHSH
jgi:hypothetical protein